VCGVVYLRTQVNHSTISVFEVIGSQMPIMSWQQRIEFHEEMRDAFNKRAVWFDANGFPAEAQDNRKNAEFHQTNINAIHADPIMSDLTCDFARRFDMGGE
jgi:hypothetical protein